MIMSTDNGNNTPEIRNSGTRQVGGIVPAPDRSEASPKSYEGPSGELSASPQLDSAIASISAVREGDFVVAMRPSPKRKSPRASNPRVIAVTRLDRDIRVVPGPPPPLREAELGSPVFTESAPELETAVECVMLDPQPSLEGEDLEVEFVPMELGEGPACGAV